MLWAGRPSTRRTGRPRQPTPATEAELRLRVLGAGRGLPTLLTSPMGAEAAVCGAAGEVLRSLATQHPDTEHQLFADDGQLNRYVNVYLNDEDVRVLEGLDTEVAKGDTLVILPARPGG